MSESNISVEEDVRNLLKCLNAVSPAYNELVQMLFILPQRAITLIEIYPELMKKEEELMNLIGLRYDERGFVHPGYGSLGGHLADLYHALFKLLSHSRKRENLLKFAGLSEEEFKEFDPLRAWIGVSLKFLARVDKDALKLLNIVITKLSGKGPDESVSWDEIKKAATDIKDPEASREILRRFFLLPYESPYYIYGRECPLLLKVYSDLRNYLNELLR